MIDPWAVSVLESAECAWEVSPFGFCFSASVVAALSGLGMPACRVPRRARPSARFPHQELYMSVFHSLAAVKEGDWSPNHSREALWGQILPCLLGAAEYVRSESSWSCTIEVGGDGAPNMRGKPYRWYRRRGVLNGRLLL